MRPGFSEFSFAYALTEQLDTGSPNPPWFLSQYAENRFGPDVILSLRGFLLFLQFKLCEGMVRDTAGEIANHRLPLTLPFLRMRLMPASLSPQHDRLLALDRALDPSIGVVLYAAPRFYEYVDFAVNYRNRQILSNSAFIKPRQIGPLPNNHGHHVSFNLSANHGWLLSEPRAIENILSGSNLLEMMRSDQEERTTLLECGRHAFNCMRASLLEQVTVNDDFMGEIEGNPIPQVRALASQYFDALLLEVVFL